MNTDHIKLLAFDADDTLWDCQSHFQAVERDYCRLLSRYATAQQVSERLFGVEQSNMAELGFGSKAFTISLVENALRVSDGRLTAAETAEILRLGKSLMRIPCTPLAGVESTLRALHIYNKVLFTKGELHDQRRKLARSGLAAHFSDVFIVPDKTPDEYLSLCRRCGVDTSQALFVGNSFRSDVEPALSVGASAIYIPFHATWQLERAEEHPHDRLVTLSRFSDILSVLL